MTVGISLTNGIEAVVITDSRVSGDGRQSDSVDKMGEIKTQNHHSVIFGSGNGNLIRNIIENLETFKGDKDETIDDYFNTLSSQLNQKIDNFEKGYLNYRKNEILKKSIIFDNPNEKEAYIHQENQQLIHTFQKEQIQFVSVGFDKKSNKIKIYYINSGGIFENNLSHIEIGSGSDGANLYFGTKLQGIDVHKIDIASILFYTTNAYSYSTINQGVDGTPKIAIINKKKLEILDLEKTRTLTNISGAYLSEFNDEVLTKKKAMGFYQQLILNSSEDNKPVLDEIAIMVPNAGL